MNEINNFAAFGITGKQIVFVIAAALAYFFMVYNYKKFAIRNAKKHNEAIAEKHKKMLNLLPTADKIAYLENNIEICQNAIESLKMQIKALKENDPVAKETKKFIELMSSIDEKAPVQSSSPISPELVSSYKQAAGLN